MTSYFLRRFSKDFESLDNKFRDELNTVFTLCKEEVCPVLNSKAQILSIPFDDPASDHFSSNQLDKFREVRDSIFNKLKNLKDLFEKDKLNKVYSEYLSNTLKKIDPTDIPDEFKKIVERNIILEKNLIIYYFSLFLCVLLGIGAKNLTRTKIGRAFSAIRDRDIAAEALGINLFKYKMYAFALSSFYAGISGSLLFIISGGIEPGTFSLLYSITFIAIVIIGGVGTVLGPLYGAFFFTMLPGIIQNVLHLVGAADSGFFLNPGEIERIVFGFFIIFFLVVEPRGIWGIWFRLRNYFKAWPFSY